MSDGSTPPPPIPSLVRTWWVVVFPISLGALGVFGPSIIGWGQGNGWKPPDNNSWIWGALSLWIGTYLSLVVWLRKTHVRLQETLQSENKKAVGSVASKVQSEVSKTASTTFDGIRKDWQERSKTTLKDFEEKADSHLKIVDTASEKLIATSSKHLERFNTSAEDKLQRIGSISRKTEDLGEHAANAIYQVSRIHLPKQRAKREEAARLLADLSELLREVAELNAALSKGAMHLIRFRVAELCGFLRTGMPVEGKTRCEIYRMILEASAPSSEISYIESKILDPFHHYSQSFRDFIAYLGLETEKYPVRKMIFCLPDETLHPDRPMNKLGVVEHLRKHCELFEPAGFELWLYREESLRSQGLKPIEKGIAHILLGNRSHCIVTPPGEEGYSMESREVRLRLRTRGELPLDKTLDEITAIKAGVDPRKAKRIDESFLRGLDEDV